ncbi:MAG: nickel-dependent lactate racemase [Candidatus Eisenbacteria bacterium]|nr:nickel-dependent lactate racemase [Candidatus Eisenbacteria bacterium]
MVPGIRYGRGWIDVPLPARAEVRVVTPAEPEPLPDPGGAVLLALEKPIDSPPLARVAEGKGSAVVVVPDATRPLPLPIVLPPILDTLAAAIPQERITILFATGMHRPVGDEEARRLLGGEVAARFRFLSHDPARVERIGVASRGTPMWIDRVYLEHSLRVLVGLVEPHLLAGFSGGRKMVAPGVIGLDAMPILHGPEMIGHRRARTGILEGNPFHEEALEIARAAGADFTVNVILGGGRVPAGVFAGELEHSHLEACRALIRSARRAVPGGADLAVTCGGGAPLDATFYQSVKGIVGAEGIVRPGGAVLLAASCDEGWGSAPFVELLGETPDLEAFLRWARRPGSFRKDQWMVQHLREAMAERRIFLFSEGLDPERTRSFGITPAAGVAEGVERALEGIGRPRVVVLPEGPYTWVVPED